MKVPERGIMVLIFSCLGDRPLSPNKTGKQNDFSTQKENNMFENNIKEYLRKTGFTTFSPKAVMFDMDGVIYNSMPNHASSWHKAMKSVGIDMPPEDAYKYEGMRGVETIQLLFRQQKGKELTDQQAAEYYKLKSDAFNSCPPAAKMEGIEDLMKKIKRSGLKIIVVTGSAQHTLLDKLEQELPGLVHKDLIVSALDVTHGKPAPEPYLKGLAKAGVQPWEAIVVENAPLGVRAGVAAKVFTVATNTGPLPDSSLLQEGADLIFSSINDFMLHWEEFAKEFGR